MEKFKPYSKTLVLLSFRDTWEMTLVFLPTCSTVLGFCALRRSLSLRCCFVEDFLCRYSHFMQIIESRRFHNSALIILASFMCIRHVVSNKWRISDRVFLSSAPISDRLISLNSDWFLDVLRQRLTMANYGMILLSLQVFNSMFADFWPILMWVDSSSFTSFWASLPWRDSTCLNVVIT